MAGGKCSIDDFEKALWVITDEYMQAVATLEKEAVDIVAKEVDSTIREHISFKQHTGDYVKAFRVKTTQEDALGKTKTWYVAAPHYRLTHLLEKGHALRQGGRAKAFPHIKYGEEIAEARMTELSEEAIKNAGR